MTFRSEKELTQWALDAQVSFIATITVEANDVYDTQTFTWNCPNADDYSLLIDILRILEHERMVAIQVRTTT